MPDDIWVTWSVDGKSAYLYHDDKTTAPVYRIELATGKRQIVNSVSVSDAADVTAIVICALRPMARPMPIRIIANCRASI